MVAIASRFPLQNVHPVEVDPDVRKTLLLTEDFQFSRRPIHAEVHTETLGPISIYVTHLKSKRPIISTAANPENSAWRHRVADTFKAISRGHVAALAQRGAEATVLYHDIANRLAVDRERAVVVMGDLNDSDDSIPIRSLLMQNRIFRVGDVRRDDWPPEVEELLFDFRLADSFTLPETTQKQVRPYTHSHRGRGGVLDYILVSNVLNQHNPDARGKVVSHQVFNQHLDRDGVDNHMQSDHGQVVITLESYRERQAVDLNLNVGEQSTASRSRQDFIDLAGGTFQSPEGYEQWRGAEKWDNFWTFFFDTDHGWVRSVYGQIPVDVLYQKQRYSIEHVVPKVFLYDYLVSKNAPTQVINGATVNPLNFVPAERVLNHRRSSFPFDMEGDRVKRPFRIDLNPDAYGQTGLDSEQEWVIPSRSRGDIARAILYMVLTYGIDELYNSHVNTLVHWAKVDSPTPWEIAYNNWVYSRLGIRNPFIDTLEKSLDLLNDSTLINSARFPESDS